MKLTFQSLLILLLLVFLFLVISTKADFTLRFNVNAHATNGNCFGDDLSLACETFLSIFCLRGRRETSSTDTSDCPLGVNNEQIGPDEDSGTREISSTAPWPGGFQMLVRALDDDNGVSNPDFLDDIIVNLELGADTGLSFVDTYTGLNSRVFVDMNFRVDCDQNFYGSDCSVFCLAQNDNVNGFFTCDQDDGSRVCLANYFGPECLTFCRPSNSELNGYFTCDPDDGSRICREGFTDPENFCTENIDDCAGQPCENGGNCTDLVADFECSCPPGYTGDNCSIDINECLEADCPANSTCVEDTVNSFVCECNAGFEGQNCTEIQPCDSVVCENGGTCVSEDPFSFECVCAAGYNGTTCELDIDECLGAVCPEGSLCTDEVDGFVCTSVTTSTQLGNIEFPSEPIPGQATAADIGLIIGCSVGGLLIIILLLLIIFTVCIVMGKRKRKLDTERRRLSNLYHPTPATLGRTGGGKVVKGDGVPLDDVMYSNADTLSVTTFGSRVAVNSMYGEAPSSGNAPVIYEQVQNGNGVIPKDVTVTQNKATVKNPLYDSKDPLLKHEDTPEPPPKISDQEGTSSDHSYAEDTPEPPPKISDQEGTSSDHSYAVPSTFKRNTVSDSSSGSARYDRLERVSDTAGSDPNYEELTPRS